MMVAIGERARINARAGARLLAGWVGLVATVVLLNACEGSSGRIDHSYWHSMYGDPDTGGPSGLLCCRHAARDSNH